MSSNVHFLIHLSVFVRNILYMQTFYCSVNTIIATTTQLYKLNIALFLHLSNYCHVLTVHMHHFSFLSTLSVSAFGSL